jgi:hypothetical protein
METTININADVLKKITLAARSHGMSRSRLVASLIKRVMEDMPDPQCIGRMVQYQKRNTPESWRTFHLLLKFDEYEYFLDLRKILKMSVSLILAYAVKLYLGQIIKKKITDNYQSFQNYIIAKEVSDTIICWKLIWGYPPNPEAYITF